jgi:hypothetical protein
MGEKGVVYRVLPAKPDGRNQLEHPGIDCRIILRLIFRTWDGGYGMD